MTAGADSPEDGSDEEQVCGLLVCGGSSSLLPATGDLWDSG